MDASASDEDSSLSAENFRRHVFLNGIIKFTADRLSQSLMIYFLQEGNTTWESFIEDEEIKMHINKKYKRFLGTLDRSDTTLLTDLIDEFPIDHTLSAKYDGDIKKLRSLRNSVGHEVVPATDKISATAYKKKISDLEELIKMFQDKYPGMVKLENLKKLLKKIEEFPTDLPTSNIHHMDEIVGRKEELRELKDRVESSPRILITGAPGIGKTSLAVTFAKALIEDPLIICLFVSLKNFKKFKICDESELENEISSVIGKHIGKIREAVNQSPKDAFVILQDYVYSIPNYAKLLIILDNIDGFDSQKSEIVLESVIKRLCPAEGNIKFLCTSRNWMTDVDIFSENIIALDRIKSRDDVLAWFQDNAKGIDVSIIQEAVLASDGVPLLMTLLRSRLLIRNRKPIKAGDISKLKLTEKQEKRIDEVLSWSFESLLQEDDLQLFMQCASIFPDFINESALKSIFHKSARRCEASAGKCFEQLADLSLIQYNDNNDKYYMHAYIQEYSQRKCSDQMKNLKCLYFSNYYSKLMKITQDHLTKRDRFDGAVETILDDVENYLEFLKVESWQFVGSVDGWLK